METQTEPLVFERTFEATQQELYEAWTDPEVYKQWINPAPGIDCVIHEFDVRVGGKVRFDMPQPDGNQHPQEGIFHELDPYDRIVTGDADRSFLMEVDFIPHNGTTTLRVKATGIPPEYRQPAVEGWNACFDKLQALLPKAA